MKLNLNFEIKRNSLDEFVRILIPELTETEVTANAVITPKEITLNLEINLGKEIKKIVFTYTNHLNKLDDQLIVMLKISMLKLMNKNYPWGGLIGVRPTKLLRRILTLGYTFPEVEELLKNLYLVTEEKVNLLVQIVKKELEFLNKDHINMYIGIPYCPTKCIYCSFASYVLKGKQKDRYDDFVLTLLEEIKLSGEALQNTDNKIESIYIGGGTPSILKEKDLESVLSAIDKYIDMTHLKEYTLEAGRVDTLTHEKLDIMKNHKVGRISLNPQTFNEQTLVYLNRPFDREKFDDLYHYGTKLGFVINMDFILGLPGEDTQDILNTLEEIRNYNMENLTIHVLALKKASNLFKEGHEHHDLDKDLIQAKIASITEEKNLKAYYMYRQKNSINWGENIGYGVPGTESRFNIEMIEENQSTFGIGGGAITKFITTDENNYDHIQRVINHKDPIGYINNMKERLEKKIKLFR